MADRPWYRVTRTERGKAFSRTETRQYLSTYTQPIHRVMIAWLYHHAWEGLTWRLVHWLERFQRRDRDDPLGIIPWGVRQNLRCYHLRMKDRIQLGTEYFDDHSGPSP